MNLNEFTQTSGYYTHYFYIINKTVLKVLSL